MLTQPTSIRVRLRNGKLARRRVSGIYDKICNDGTVYSFAYHEGKNGTTAYRITERDSEGPIWSAWI